MTCTALVDKMKRRHPHVYGDVMVKDAGEVLANWGGSRRPKRKPLARPSRAGR